MFNLWISTVSIRIIKDIFAKQRHLSSKIIHDRFDFIELTKSTSIDRAFWLENFRLALSQEYLELLDEFENEDGYDMDKVLSEFADCLGYLANITMMAQLKEENVAVEFLRGLDENEHPIPEHDDLFRHAIVKLIFKILIRLQHCRRWKWFGLQDKPVNESCLNNIRLLWYSFGCLANRNNINILIINDAFNRKHDENLLRLEQGYYKQRIS